MFFEFVTQNQLFLSFCTCNEANKKKLFRKIKIKIKTVQALAMLIATEAAPPAHLLFTRSTRLHTQKCHKQWSLLGKNLVVTSEAMEK
jgi:hypothetical protein